MSEPPVPTSPTLLDRLCAPEGAVERHDAWSQFVELYTPLLTVWARRRGFQQADANDLIQGVLLHLLEVLPRYAHQGPGSFRRWLCRVLDNAATDFRRRHNRPGLPLGAPNEVVGRSTEAEWDEAEYRQFVARRALEIVGRGFPERAVAAFARHVVDGRPAADVAADLGIPVGTVYSTCNRVLTRLRGTLAGLTD